MALSVIGAGFGRTGTMSIKKALEHLGVGPCHHMMEVFSNPDEFAKWQVVVERQQIDWDDVFLGYNAAIGWPSAHYWRELADVYPNSKILLSVRPADHWWKSFSSTIKTVLDIRDAIPDDYLRSVAAMAHNIIAEQTFQNTMNDKIAALSAFQKRIDDVKQAIPTERLLIFDVAEGWGPLCEFMEIPVPDLNFPHSNCKDEFLKVFGRIGGSDGEATFTADDADLSYLSRA